MGKAPVVQVEGAKELRATLKAAGADMEDMKDANAQVATTVATAASGAAPRVSGTLAGSVRGNRAAGSAVVKVGGAAIPYAGPIHWGWSRRNIKANPFAVDAAHETEPAWTETYLQAVQRILDKVTGAPGNG